MWLMSVTCDTSHFKISSLKDVAPMKMELISVILDTSHCSIAPSTPSEQSDPWENFRQLSTARLSFGLDCGENTASPAQESGDMDKTTRAKKVT